MKQESQSDDKHVIAWPKNYLYIMVGCSVISCLIYLFILLLMIFAPESIVDYDEYSILQFSLLFVPFILAVIILTVYLARFKVIVKKDCFIYKNLFKRTRIYYYDKVYSTFIGRSYHCYQNNKLIVKISTLQDNSHLLHKCIEAYQKKYKIIPKDDHNGVIKRTRLWMVFSVCYLVLSAIFNVISFIYAWWWYFTLVCHIPNILFVLSCLLWKITIKDGVLTKRSLFKWNKRYKLEELTFDINNSGVLYKICRGKKIIAFVLAIEYDSSLIKNNLRYNSIY